MKKKSFLLFYQKDWVLKLELNTNNKYKMKNIIYPREIEMMSRLLKNNEIKEKALKNAEKEFLQFNICEGKIENVY